MSQNCNFLREGEARGQTQNSQWRDTSIYFLEQHNTGKFIYMCTNIELCQQARKG